ALPGGLRGGPGRLDHRRRRGGGRRRDRRRQRRDERAPRVPAREHPEPRLAQRPLHRRDRGYFPARRLSPAVEEAVTELAGGHLTARTARIAAVVAKHGLRDRLEGGRSRAARLRAALEELGPTFAKLGQILSTRPD